MHKAPILKATGLKAIDDESEKKEQVEHVFGRNLEERVLASASDQAQVDQPTIANQEQEIDTIKKRKFDAITGEEDESTIFQDDFRLFTWDKDHSNWVEKGRGLLKLNEKNLDKDKSQSRLIMRIRGTYRIILNVALNSSFQIISASKENIRFTDSQTMWAASGKNVNKLKLSIEERLIGNKKLKELKTDSSPDTRSNETDPNENQEKKEKEEGSTEKDQNDVKNEDLPKDKSPQSDVKDQDKLSSDSDSQSDEDDSNSESECQSDEINREDDTTSNKVSNEAEKCPDVD